MGERPIIPDMGAQDSRRRLPLNLERRILTLRFNPQTDYWTEYVSPEP